MPCSKENKMPRVDAGMVTSAFELPGYRIIRNFGIVPWIYRALAERHRKSRRRASNYCRRQHHILTNLCEKTREDAFELFAASAHLITMVTLCQKSGTQRPRGIMLATDATVR